MRAGALALALLVAGCGGTRPSAYTAAADTPPQSPDTGTKPYTHVGIEAAETEPGLFTVHRLGAKLLFEIPDSLMGRDLLSVGRIAQAPAGLSPFVGGGTKTAEQVIRWERSGDRVLLRTQSFAAVADTTLPVARSVRVNNFQPVVAAIDVEAVSLDSAGCGRRRVCALHVGRCGYQWVAAQPSRAVQGPPPRREPVVHRRGANVS